MLSFGSMMGKMGDVTPTYVATVTLNGDKNCHPARIIICFVHKLDFLFYDISMFV
jgi:hypothetical protein